MYLMKIIYRKLKYWITGKYSYHRHKNSDKKIKNIYKYKRLLESEYHYIKEEYATKENECDTLSHINKEIKSEINRFNYESSFEGCERTYDDIIILEEIVQKESKELNKKTNDLKKQRLELISNLKQLKIVESKFNTSLIT